MDNNHLFKQNIIQALHLEALPDDQKIDLIDQMAALTEQRIILKLIDTLSEKDAALFSQLTSDDEKIKFLRDKITNLDEIIKDEITQVKKELITNLDHDEDLKNINQLSDEVSAS